MLDALEISGHYETIIESNEISKTGAARCGRVRVRVRVAGERIEFVYNESAGGGCGWNTNQPSDNVFKNIVKLLNLLL